MSEINDDQIRNALARVLGSDEFRSSESRSRFLDYVVTETLEGRAGAIKGYSIAVDVYGRDADFDPQTDPVVRVEASRLRRELEHYYLTAGLDDEIKFVIPKGRYVPSFELNTADDKSAASSSTQADAGNIPVPQQATGQTRQRRRIAGWAIFAGLTAVLATAAGIGWLTLFGNGSSGGPSPPKSANVIGPTVFVVPFEAVSASSGETPLAKGISIEIVNVLSQFVELRVLPVAPNFRVSELKDDSRTEDAGLQFVLNGSVQLSGDDVRITAGLQNALDGIQIWSERYDSEFYPNSIFDVQERIAADVAQRLAEPYGLLRKFSRRQMATQRDPGLDAYKCVLAAYEYRRNFTPEMHLSTRTCLEQSVKTDPSYSRAWALLAYTIADENRLFYNMRPKSHARALEAARQAVKLNPDDILSHQALSLAFFNNGDIKEALDAGRNAVALNPHNKEALMQLGLRTAFSGGWEEGFALAQRAKAESPMVPSWYYFIPALYYYQRQDYEKAKAAAEALGLRRLVLAEATRAMIIGQLGMRDLARKILANCRRLDPQFDARARSYFAAHQFDDDVLEHFMEGLHKAGLKPQ